MAGPELEHRLFYVQPGQPAFEWLASVVRDLKDDDPFRAVTIIVPSAYAGRMALEHLAHDGGYLNLQIHHHVDAIAKPLAGNAPTAERRELNRIVERSAVGRSLRTHGGPLAQLDHPSLRRLLVDRFREIRRAELDCATADAPRPAARALFEMYHEFSRLVAGYDTPTTRANAAARRLSEAGKPPSWLPRLGTVVLFLPTRLDPAEVRFLAALARWTPLVAAFPFFQELAEVGSPPRADQRPLEGHLVESHLEGQPSRLSSGGQPGDPAGRKGSPSDMPGLLAGLLGLDAPRVVATPTTPPRARIIRAPDPAEEVREVVRAIAGELDQGIALYRIAVVYRHGDPYASLIRDALDAASLPWISSEGVRLADTRPGRALLMLLSLADRGFTREGVLEWLETAPLLTGDIAKVSIGAWDRLSRLAGVARGGEQWTVRLERFAARMESEIRISGADPDPSDRVISRLREIREARLISGFMGELADALQPPPASATWSDFVDWAVDLWNHFIGAAERWPETQRARAGAVRAALEEFRIGDEVEPLPGSAGFREALADALESQRVEIGQPGEGVMVEPLVAMMGLAFDRVYLLGMREGAYPPPPPVDPFFPEEDGDPLQTRLRQRIDERRDFLAAASALEGSGATLVLCLPESDGQRPSFPSRWLLEVASRLEGQPIDAESFSRLSERHWLRVVRSAQAGVLAAAAPADLEDRRLADVARWRMQGRPADRHPMVQRPDLPLGRALLLAAERGSDRLTAYDGNLGSTVKGTGGALAGFSGGAAPTSATALETWATCGFKFFLTYVLRIEPTDRPSPGSSRLDRRERGSLVHEILSQFFRSLRTGGRPGPNEAFTPDDVAELERIALLCCSRIEETGAAGHPLAWAVERQNILTDLRLFLLADAAERRRTGFYPTHFEKRFGSPRSDSWPALEVKLSSADAPGATFSPGNEIMTLRFRGTVDRVDLSLDGTAAWAYDYKTGRSNAYKGITADPVLAGQHLQLALYRRALRQNLSGLTSIGASFWFVSSPEKFETVGVADTAEVDQRLDAVLETIVRGVQRGAFPQVPGAPDRVSYATCATCDFDRVCPARRDRLWARKQGDPASAIHRALTRVTAVEGGGENRDA